MRRVVLFFFFFQAEDGIRDVAVTGVQTCALPISYPCVLKPLRLSASRGVIRADTPAEFVAAFERIKRILEQTGCARSILVEEFVPGREVAVEGLVTHGALHVLAIFDKPDPLDGPFFEETIYVTPSRLARTAQQEIAARSEEHTSELQSRLHLVCRLLLEKKKKNRSDVTS